MSLFVRLFVCCHYVSGDAVTATYEITNNGLDLTKVRRWGTPLDGIVSDCLDVWRGDVRLPYIGPRARPGVTGPMG